jgi:hypothetical protein
MLYNSVDNLLYNADARTLLILYIHRTLYIGSNILMDNLLNIVVDIEER